MSTSHVEPVSSPVPEYVDWLVAAFVGLAGIALTAAGTVLIIAFDRAVLAEEVAAGRVTVGTVEHRLTEGETVSLATDVVNWTGIGLLVTGVGLLVFAVGYAFLRYRARRRDGGPTNAEHARHAAVCGAAATAVLSFLPVSPAFGGAVASYLDRPGSGRSVRVGALSGALVAVPTVVILGFTTVGLFTGLEGVGEDSLRSLVLALLAASVLLTVLSSVGLGGLGGYIEGRYSDRE